MTYLRSQKGRNYRGIALRLLSVRYQIVVEILDRSKVLHVLKPTCDMPEESSTFQPFALTCSQLILCVPFGQAPPAKISGWVFQRNLLEWGVQILLKFQLGPGHTTPFGSSENPNPKSLISLQEQETCNLSHSCEKGKLRIPPLKIQWASFICQPRSPTTALESCRC